MFWKVVRSHGKEKKIGFSLITPVITHHFNVKVVLLWKSNLCRIRLERVMVERKKLVAGVRFEVSELYGMRL